MLALLFLVVLLVLVALGFSYIHKLLNLEKDLHSASKVTHYSNFFTDETSSERNKKYRSVVNGYYDIATDFYEYGWGESYHFARRFQKESFKASIARHEHYLAHKMGLKPGDKVLDVGCGVGGPMRAIARFSGASVVGLNNNQYQVGLGSKKVAREKLSHLCSFLKADFMKIPVPDGHFSHAYEIEATCHAPDRVACYSEILRTIRPGGYFAGYEWALTDKYDSSNPEHLKIRDDILIGNGLPDMITCEEVKMALRKAGFEIVEFKDLAAPDDENPVPWYQPLAPAVSMTGFKSTRFGIALTSGLLYVLESLKLAAKGSYHTQAMLSKGAAGLLQGGKTKTFTPMLFFVARKPLA